MVDDVTDINHWTAKQAIICLSQIKSVAQRSIGKSWTSPWLVCDVDVDKAAKDKEVLFGGKSQGILEKVNSLGLYLNFLSLGLGC